MKLKKLWIGIGLSFILLQAGAQETRTITLQQAIDLSIQNSKLLKNNKARIAEATASLKEAEERKLPDAGVSGSYLYLPVKPNIQLKSGGNAGGISVSQVIYGTLNVSMPIYTGGKLNYGIESARFLEQAEKLDAEVNKSALTINTINAFSNLYKARYAVMLVEENLKEARQRVKDFSNLEQNGLLARNDLLKAELQASNIELSLLDAQNNWKMAGVNMSLMLGIPENSSLIADSTSLLIKTSVKTIEEYEQLALQTRKDLAALNTREKATAIGIKAAHADYYPSAALTAGYIAADLPGFISITNAINIGVGVKYSISSLWKTKTKISIAQSKLDEIKATEELFVDKIRLQINQAYENYLLSVKKIEVYQKAIIQSEENYRITKNKYDNTLATTTDLLEADLAQLQAKLNYNSAQSDAVVAYYTLLNAAGINNLQ